MWTNLVVDNEGCSQYPNTLKKVTKNMDECSLDIDIGRFIYTAMTMTMITSR